MSNPWILHVKKYAADNGLKYGEALKLAKPSYQPIQRPVVGGMKRKKTEKEVVKEDALADLAKSLEKMGIANSAAPQGTRKGSPKRSPPVEGKGSKSDKAKANAVGAIPAFLEVGKDVAKGFVKTFDPEEIKKTRKRQAKMDFGERLIDTFQSGPVATLDKSLRKHKAYSKLLAGIDGGIVKSLGYGAEGNGSSVMNTGVSGKRVRKYELKKGKGYDYTNGVGAYTDPSRRSTIPEKMIKM